MKWIPLLGIFWFKKDEPDDVVYTYQLICAMVLWPILLYFLLKIIPVYDTQN